MKSSKIKYNNKKNTTTAAVNYEMRMCMILYVAELLDYIIVAEQ